MRGKGSGVQFCVVSFDIGSSESGGTSVGMAGACVLILKVRHVSADSPKSAPLSESERGSPSSNNSWSQAGIFAANARFFLTEDILKIGRSADLTSILYRLPLPSASTTKATFVSFDIAPNL